MNGRIIAFFACTFLSVSMSIPAVAEEAGGVILAIDEEAATLTFEDGSTYALPRTFDYAAVKPGMRVHVIYDALSR